MNPPAPAMDSTPVAPPATARVISVDALRGFDMFWIIGAGSLVQALDKMSGNGVTRFLCAQLKHVPWEGFRFYDLIFPLIKRIRTSSFCVLTSGCSAMLLGVFYFVVDVCKFQTWCQPFVWIGMNSITIYLTVSVVSFSRLAEHFVGGDVRAFLDAHVANGFGGLVVALAGLALAVLLCWFLHRNKIFLRV